MDSPISEPAEKAILALGTGEELPSNTALAYLSGLTISEISLFRKEWRKLETERRRRVISRLVELAEDNLEYNFDSIFRQCLRDTDEEVRSQAIEGLWENEETSLIDPLIALLEQDESEKVQAAAAKALGKFAVLAELDKLRPENVDKVRETLLGAIEDSNKSEEVIRRAIEAAAPLNLPDVKEAIKNAWESNNPGFKISAVYAMGKSCDTSWMPVLLRELENEDVEIRYEAAGACGELECEEAVPSLITLAKYDDDVEVRMAAIQALGKIGNVQAREYLEQCLKNTSIAVREAAQEAIQNIDATDDPLSLRM